jgi:hypothetical protein
VTGWTVCAGLRGLAAAALLGGLTAAAVPVGAHAGERHAGTVLAVDVQARTLIVDEYRANGERRALRVQVPGDALVLQSERNAASRDVTDVFRDSSITLADVRTGDFVVIELSEDPDVARLVMITWRRGGGS